MKKTVLLPLAAVAVALLVLAGYAATDNSTAAAAFLPPETAARAVGENEVLVEVLHARVCGASRHHQENRCIQEVSARVLAAGKQVRGLHSGDCVGFRGEITPCGECSACRTGHRENCRDAGWFCPAGCRSHGGQCRSRLVTPEGNLVKFTGCETSDERFTRLCAADLPCLRLPCRTQEATDSSTLRGCHRHSHGRRHCR